MLTLCLGELDHLTRDSAEGTQWRKYLLLDALQAWSAAHNSPADRLPSDFARRLLSGCTAQPCCRSRGRSCTDGPVAILHPELLRHVAEPVNMEPFPGRIWGAFTRAAAGATMPGW